MRRTKRLGRYHLTERIAFGGMAELFRAFTFDADGFRRDVAIKRLLPHFVSDQQFITMLTDEFGLVSHLKHPNIAEVFELLELEDTLLIAMEYVDGKDLRSCAERGRRLGAALGLDDIAYLMARALDGLHHAHVARDAQGRPLKIVHRDFSPSNLLLSYDGTVKLCDFGIAKATHNRIETKTGIIKGKVKYMSPEQAFGRRLDWRSDVFSAGSVLYELLTSTSPFVAPNEIDLIFAVRDAEPVPCQEINPELPADLVEVVEKAMSRSRSARYQTAMEFRDALLVFLRRYNPRYRRTKLSRFMKYIWKDEIERDLRAMEDYVLDGQREQSGSLGRNLIAGALGPDAAYNKFSPEPTAGVDGHMAAEPVDAVHHARTELIEASKFAPPAADPSLAAFSDPPLEPPSGATEHGAGPFDTERPPAPDGLAELQTLPPLAGLSNVEALLDPSVLGGPRDTPVVPAASDDSRFQPVGLRTDVTDTERPPPPNGRFESTAVVSSARLAEVRNNTASEHPRPPAPRPAPAPRPVSAAQSPAPALAPPRTASAPPRPASAPPQPARRRKPIPPPPGRLAKKK